MWVKLDSINSTKHLYALYGETEMRSYMEIFRDSFDQVACAPFGVVSERSPRLIYDHLTDSAISTYGWLHLSCSFTFESEVVATLFNSDLDKTYNLDISQVPDYLKADNYRSFVGNSVGNVDGSMNAMFREVRFWGIARSAS